MEKRMVLHLNQLESPFSKKKNVLSKDETNSVLGWNWAPDSEGEN